MMNEDLKDEIRTISCEKVDEFHRQRSEYLDDGITRAVPSEIDFEKHSIAEILNYEKYRLMNLASKVNYYYYVAEGWDRARYCECGANHYYECTCSSDSRLNRHKYVKRKKQELFSINDRLMTITSIGWKLSDVDQAEKMSDNLLQGLENYPLLRRKIASITGKAVQNYSVDSNEENENE